MGLSIDEQETVVIIMRGGDTAEVYTSNTRMMAKLDKLAEDENAPCWKLKEECRLQTGELVGKKYVTDKRLIAFRRNLVTRTLTEEQREAGRQRLAEYRERKRREREMSGSDAQPEEVSDEIFEDDDDAESFESAFKKEQE